MRAPVDSPHTLAALRIAVALTILVSPELQRGQLALDQVVVGAAPWGLGWLEHWTQHGLSSSMMNGLRVLALSSTTTALIGYHSRVSCAVMAISAGLSFGVSQLGGATLHNMHLIWLAALLSVSRSGDAWSLDRGKQAASLPATHYGLALSFARALLGAVYFFPGLHKLLGAGPAWISADNLVGHMHAKWFQTGEIPYFRVDELPLACELGGAFVVGFELAAPLLFLVPRLRLLGLAAGLAFHLSTDLLMNIRFTGLVTCYVMLIPWQRVLRLRFFQSEAEREPAATPTPLETRLLTAVGGALLIGAVLGGATGQTQAWPFGCYPTFAHLMGPTVPDLNLRLTFADGSQRLLTGRSTTFRDQMEWRRVYFLLGAYPGHPSAKARERFARELFSAARPTRPVHQAELVIAHYSSAPSEWGKPPVRVVPLSVIAQERLTTVTGRKK